MKISRANFFTSSHLHGCLRENILFISFLILYIIRVLRNFLNFKFDCLYFHVKTESYYITGKQSVVFRTESIILRILHLIELGSVIRRNYVIFPL